jgi:iron-sulfur cluster assembly accessory protein
MIEIDRSAAKELAVILKPGQALHIGVRGGGCSGFEYQLLVGEDGPDSIEIAEIPVVVAPEAEPLLEQARLTWDEGDALNPGGFRFENEGFASCGCGKSFGC